MEIKEPKFKVGDKVTTPQKGREVFGTIARIKYYDFPKGTYIYTVKFERDGFTEELYLDELVLDAYTEKPKTVYGENNYYITVKSDAWLTINLYSKETKSNGWCENYERKGK